MKTRRKTTKRPSKGRRSSVICVKKSPINRKNTARVLRSQAKSRPSFHYDSPLKCVLSNGPGKSSLSTNKETDDVNMDEDLEVKDDLEEKCSDMAKLNLKDIPVDQIDTNKEDSNSNFADSNTENSTTSKRKAKVDMLTALQNRKKRKTVKKSPLSRFNESHDKLSESVIILDDSESLTDTKAILTESKKNITYAVNTSCQEVDQSIVKTEPLSNISNSELSTNNDEVIVIDCDSTLMEMEAFHNAFNEHGNCSPVNSSDTWSPPSINENWSPVNSNENWSPTNPIIEIPDDDSPIQTRHASPKPSDNCLAPIQSRHTSSSTNDDCFVVWSSLVNPSTSNAVPQKLSTPVPNYKSDLLKYDKIFLDTTPDISNLRVLNNENNKPNKSVKSTKDTTKTKKSLLKSPKATKAATRTTKAATKTTKAVTATTKAATATAKATTVRTKAATATTKATTATTKAATATSKAATATSKAATATSKAATITSKAATATSKAASATSKTAVKKRTKNKGELIFLSESREEDESAKKTKSKKGKLREIVIDGSNVAMAYTHSKFFSEKGIKMLIDYFTKRGHTVKVFVPQYRRSRNFPLLEKWYTDGIVVFTPSRKLGNKTFTPYDDRYILEYATARNGIVVSQDQFRDLYQEKPEYRDTIENRILVPTFVGDYVMFPEDPLGRDGPSLSDFLKH